MATLTITTTTAQDQRLGPAFGAKLGLGRNATASEVKAHFIDYMRQVVQDHEREESIRALSATAFDPS